jgi:dTMP kinase
MHQKEAKLPRFICLEGLDGVGKTEVASLLARRISYQFFQSPGGSFGKARKIVDDGQLSPLTRYFFFRAATQNDSKHIAEILKSSGVVCDRYIYSTVAYHAAMDERVRQVFETTDLLLPDRTILLVARDEVRKARLEKRDHVTQIEMDIPLQKRIDFIYRSFVHDIFDTSDTTVEEAADHIASILGIDSK